MYSGAAAYEQHRNFIRAKDDWPFLGDLSSFPRARLDFGKLNALATLLTEDKIAGAPEIEFYTLLQQKLRSMLPDPTSALRILEGDVPSRQVWNYYTLLDSLEDIDFVSHVEAEDAAKILDYDENVIDGLHESYEFRNEMAVRRFLREHLFLEELLMDAREEIQRHFDSDVRLALEVIREADANSAGRLFVLILTSLPPREAMTRLEELDRTWWLQALPRARGKATLDIEYD